MASYLKLWRNKGVSFKCHSMLGGCVCEVSTQCDVLEETDLDKNIYLCLDQGLEILCSDYAI